MLNVGNEVAEERRELRADLSKKLFQLRKELGNYTSTTGVVGVNARGGAVDYGMTVDEYKALERGLREADSGLNLAIAAAVGDSD
jgi:hypothetical protein